MKTEYLIGNGRQFKRYTDDVGGVRHYELLNGGTWARIGGREVPQWLMIVDRAQFETMAAYRKQPPVNLILDYGTHPSKYEPTQPPPMRVGDAQAPMREGFKRVFYFLSFVAAVAYAWPVLVHFAEAVVCK